MMNKCNGLLLFPLLILSGCQNDGEFPVVGTLERDRIVLTAELHEPVVAIHVREGERVTAGTPLLELDTRRAHTDLERLSARRDQLQRRLDELLRGPRRETIDEAQARLRATESSVVNTRHEYERIQRLRERGLSSERELDQTRTAFEMAAGERDAAGANLEALLEGTTIEELDQARAALAEAEASHRRQELTMERLILHSPRDAVVEALPFELGESPQAGAAVAVLHATDRPPYARVYVPAALRAHLQPGTSVQVDVDGRRTYTGTVRFLAGEAAFTPYFALTEHDADRLSYLAEIDIRAGEALPTGVPVRVVSLTEN